MAVWYSAGLQSGGCGFESRPGQLRSTQPSIPPGSVNEYQLLLGWQRQVWLIPLAGETHCEQAYPLTMRVIPERLSDYLYILPLPLHLNV